MSVWSSEKSRLVAQNKETKAQRCCSNSWEWMRQSRERVGLPEKALRAELRGMAACKGQARSLRRSSHTVRHAQAKGSMCQGGRNH